MKKKLNKRDDEGIRSGIDEDDADDDDGDNDELWWSNKRERELAKAPAGRRQRQRPTLLRPFFFESQSKRLI